MLELRDLPQVDRLAGSEALKGWQPSIRAIAARRAVDEARLAIQRGSPVTAESIASRAVEIAFSFGTSPLKPAINMSGVILHTGLGRAKLAPSVVAAMTDAANAHTFLELDEETGVRSNRQDHLRDLLRELTGAEDALVVNNAAGALALTLQALCKDREVLLARSQLVQIGGSFRLPDLVKACGVRIVEVGCTNKSEMGDYRVNSRTGAILVCHRSNYEVVGFVGDPSLNELSNLGVPLIHDQGTGCMIDLEPFGIQGTATMKQSLRSGSSICLGSGDKLLGGPQAGIIVGKADLISKIARHPMARAFRVDKLTVAGLAETLRLYLTGREQEIPTIKFIAKKESEVLESAKELAKSTKGARVEASTSEIGGGAGHGLRLPTWRVGYQVGDAEKLACDLRRSSPGVVGRIEKGIYWLDPRTAEEDEIVTVSKLMGQYLR